MSDADFTAEADAQPAVPRDQALTLRSERLLGSDACLNCGTELRGPYCHYCGQPDRNFLRFFPALLRELAEDLLELDSRFWRTLKPLLFHPGKLTRDFLDGRRFRYTPPLRLYIFSSLAFFVLAAFLSLSAIEPGDIQTGFGDGGLRIEMTDDEDVPPEDAAEIARQAVESARAQAEARGDTERLQALDEALSELEDVEPDEPPTIQFNDEPWDRETNPVIIPYAPDWFNEWVNDEIEESPAKAQRIEDDPRIIVEQIFDVLPISMFLLLPVAALLYKFWYLFAKRYYFEHLMFALHNHAFVFVIFTVILVLEWIADDLLGPDVEAAQWIVSTISTLLLIWIPFYFLFALKRVYQQGWLMTIGKYFAIGISYWFLLLLTTTAVALAGFVLL